MVDDKENQPCSFKIAHHHNHRVSIKLKILKHEEDVDEDDHQSSSQEKNNHQNTKICQVCNKVFTSGKALGGHMRIHVEGYNNKELLISKKKKLKAKQSIKFKKQKVCDFAKNKNVVNGDKRKKPKCVLCGKNFPSMKSLFGHMRCHPERDWRGIEPPSAAKINSSSTWSAVSDAEPETADDQVDSGGDGGGDANEELMTKVDLAESNLPGWSVTAKRGRKFIMISSSEEEEEEVCIAAQNMLLLRDGDSFDSSLTHKQKIDEFGTTNSSSLSYKVETDDANRVLEVKRRRNMEESHVGFSDDQPLMQLRNGGHVQGHELGVGKGKSAVESADWVNECAEKDSSDDESDHGELLMIKSKKRRKRMKLRDLDQMKDANPTLTPDKYRCSTCGKCFSTHQALGGHRSSHNKLKIVSHNSIDESSSPAAEDDNYLANTITQVEENKESEGAASSKLVVEGTHQCNICNKIFHSGQALGGHKRSHWSGTMEAQSSPVMSAGEVSQTGRRFLDFDLNEAPPMEDEANINSEQVAGYGYAISSSYDSVA